VFGKTYFLKIKGLYHRHERWFTPSAFFAGFIWDNFTLRIDLWWQNLAFLLYLIIAGANIALMNACRAGKIRGKVWEKYKGFAPYIFQFVFGGLFSAFLVFYSRSASLAASWPFLIFLALFFIGNEYLKKKYLHLTFQICVFFIALFSYLVFALPLAFGEIGNLMFMASGLAALFCIGVILYLFYRLMPGMLKQNKHALILSIASLYFLFQIFYFTNIIPPIPLTLKASGVYHSIERVANKEDKIYSVTYEASPRHLFFQEQSNTFHWAPGEKVYFYSAVFAPIKFNLPIYHRWLYFDESKNDWFEKAKVSFSVIGGRDGGYRGYSYKANIQPGKWRVEVITKNGKVLGRRDFKIIAVESPPELKIMLR